MAVRSRKALRMLFDERVRGALDFAAGLQDHGVGGLDGQRTDLRDGVGPRLEDHGEQAERAAYFFEFEAGVELGAVEHAADRIGQARRRRGRRRSSTRACRQRAPGDRPAPCDNSPRATAAWASRVSAALAARISADDCSKPWATASSARLRSSPEVDGDGAGGLLGGFGKGPYVGVHGRFPGEKSVPTVSPAQSMSRMPGVRPLAMTAAPALHWRCARLRAWFPCRRGRGRCRRGRSCESRR